MALVVETGAGVSGSNTYVSLTDAQAFLDLRELDVTLTEGLLLRAMDALAGVTFSDGVIAEPMPTGVINAQIWLAYHISENDAAASSGTTTQQIKKEKVDVLEVEYYESSSDDSTGSSTDLLDYPNVVASLKGLTGSSALSGFLQRA